MIEQDFEESKEKIIEFDSEPFNFEKAGFASTEIKRILKSLKIDSALIRRIGIASYELEINQVIHSLGGKMIYHVDNEKVVIEAVDIGPGIPDLEKALTEGFSTATEKVRSMGFGAGMGLPNTKRVSDDFKIESSSAGTKVTSIIYIKENL